MKFLLSLLLVVGSASAFVTPSSKAFVVAKQGNVARFMAQGGDQVPFFANSDDDSSSPEKQTTVEDITLEEEVDAMVQAEVAKKKRVSNLRNEKGVDYAPWMKISEEDETKIRALMKEKAEARRKRQDQERSVSGNLYYDSQAQELSGAGLNSKIIDGEVELEWATKEESNTKGFIVKRRAAKTNDFSVLATYENWGPLASKGAEGGIYRYLDTTVTPGGWVYRITECDASGEESDLCQCLVEVQTQDEQRAGLIAGVAFAVVALAAVAAGVFLDPMEY